jgi:uncharacterized protein (DUF427 family)
MSLTFGDGPLSANSRAPTNYLLEAPARRMLFQPYPRRMRALVGGRVVLDSERGHLLHETGAPPSLYFPREDYDGEALERSETATECPQRGRASYWSIHADGVTLPDVVWGYEQPKAGYEWLRDELALDFDAPDAWLCEDERLFGHLRDPFHRVDVFESSREVTVWAAGRTIARSRRPRLLFETGLPVRAYMPATDVAPGLLWPSHTRTICPYKGEAWHWTLRADGERIEDAAWSYETPLPEAYGIRGYLCFYDTKVEVQIGPAPERFSLAAGT